VEAVVGGGQQEAQLVLAEVGVAEGGGEAVEALPVLLVDLLLHLLEERRAGIRREELELGHRRAERDRVLDRGRDRVPGIGVEPEDVEPYRPDAEALAARNDVSLLRFGNRPAADLAQRVRRERLDAESDRAQTGLVHRAQEVVVEAIEPRLALPAQAEPPA